MRPKSQSQPEKSRDGVKTVFKTKLLFIWKKITNNKLVTIIFLVIILFLAILIWTFTSINNIIVGGGSTSVNDVMVDTTNAYHKQTGQDVLYNSLGSAAALVGVKNGSYNFGFLSEDIPDHNGTNNVDAVNLWNSNKILRFAIAQDYIMLIYHVPSECSVTGDSLKFILTDTTSSNTIRNIYLNHATWGNVFGNQMTCPYDISDTPFFTLTREAGSGTRQFFEKSIIQTTDYKTNQVATSNGDMFQAVENTPNSIGYISFSFLKDVINSNLTQKAIGSVKDGNGVFQLPYNPDNLSFNSAYPEVRPFTGIIGKLKTNPALNFISWLLDPIPYYKYENDETSLTALENYTNTSDWKNSAAYWYIKNGARPVSIKSSYSPPENVLQNPTINSIYNYYNNNESYLKNLTKPNINSDYKSIYTLIYNKLLKKYQTDLDAKNTLDYLLSNSYPH